MRKRDCKKPTISFAMVTKNEETLLPQCLDSIKKVADEILIIDTNSTDRTLAIARDYGARVYQSDFEKNRSKGRNIYLKQAKCDWIFTLDADERIAEKDVPKLKKLVFDKKVTGYVFNSRLYTPNYDLLFNWYPCSGEYPREEAFSGCPGYIDIEWGLRLFRNIKGLSYSGYIHEAINQSIIKQKGVINNVNIPLHHFKYVAADKDYRKIAGQRFEAELKHNSRIFRDLYRYYFRVGRDYLLIRKNYKKAHQFLEKAIALKPGFAPAYFLIAFIYNKKGLYPQAVKLLKKILTIEKDYIGARYLLAIAYDAQGQFRLAEAELAKALKVNSQHPIVLNALGVILSKQGKLKPAREYFKKAVHLYPGFPAAKNNLKKIK